MSEPWQDELKRQGSNTIAETLGELAALKAENQRLREALEDVIQDADQSCVNYCEKWKDYGRHAPECWADTADACRAALNPPRAAELRNYATHPIGPADYVYDGAPRAVGGPESNE